MTNCCGAHGRYQVRGVSGVSVLIDTQIRRLAGIVHRYISRDFISEVTYGNADTNIIRLLCFFHRQLTRIAFSQCKTKQLHDCRTMMSEGHFAVFLIAQCTFQQSTLPIECWHIESLILKRPSKHTEHTPKSTVLWV